MKKFLATVCFIAVFVFSLAFGACAKEEGTISVYAPDGAPALALAQVMDKEISKNVTTEYHVVDASTIQTYVTGDEPKADICVLPVNIACKLLGDGTAYKLAGSVTHGNLFIMAKAAEEEITKQNLASLAGKTVGVVNLAAIPGLTTKLLLNDNGIEYNVLANDSAPAADKVNLKAVSGDEAVPGNTTCDYFVVPEPAASTKQSKTGGALQIKGNIQTIYNEGSGYPQAVLVVKNSLIESNPAFVSDFLKAVKEGAESLASADPQSVAAAVTAHLNEGATPTFTAENLTKQVIENCAVKFVPASECKTAVTEFVEKLIAVQADSSKKPADGFFYTLNAQ